MTDFGADRGEHVDGFVSVPTERFIVGNSTLPVTFEMTLTSVTPTVIVVVSEKVEMLDPPGAINAVLNWEVVGTATVGEVTSELQPMLATARESAPATDARETKKRKRLSTAIQSSSPRRARNNAASTRFLTPACDARSGRGACVRPFLAVKARERMLIAESL